VKAPFPYFGGKREIASAIWSRLGRPRQYIEPFCGSAAVLLAAPTPAALEVVCDLNGFIANFWRAVKHQPAEVANAADYPVSHIDLGARHRWLMEQRERMRSWLGSQWCGRDQDRPHAKPEPLEQESR
jgi:site-specific DNA-adenine methylase